MTLNDISRKLIKNNFKQYGLFFFSVLFSIVMVGAYGVLQFSPTITNVLADGGSTQVISTAMFFGSMLGIIVFLVYANSLFLKHKSREIGIFLSLGINRRAICKIVVKEHSLLFQLAAVIGLLLSVPVAFLSWSLLNVFLKTQETAFEIGWAGLMVACIFAVFSWLILRAVNGKYINSVDIIKILKTSVENEKAKDGSLFLCVFGFVLIPMGIVAFFSFQNMAGILYTVLAYIGLIAAAWGVYIFIIQLASAGDILKRYNVKAYYRNIVFYNLLKQKIRQYTRSIFVATLLITFTIFGIGFIAAGFIDGYYTAMNEPYDYTINASSEQPNLTEERIFAVAEESGTKITEIKTISGLLIGMKNTYIDGGNDWSSRLVINESNYNALAPEPVSVSQGSYTLYYDGNMSYKLNAFYGSDSVFYNPSAKAEFTLSKNEPVSYEGLFNSRSFFSSFLILNDEDYRQLVQTIGKEYQVVSYLLKVENWESTEEFQNAILDEVISESGGQIYSNWHNSAVFDKTGGKAEYFPYDGNETRTVRVWALYPLSKLSSTTTQFEAFATYLMLMLFIAIIAFVSSIMVIGLKLISTIWDDANVYNNLQKLGLKRKGIMQLITKQILFIYFIPTMLGCGIGAFTTYRIMLVSSVTYIEKVMALVGGLCTLVFILQIVIFFVIRNRVMRDYVR